MTPVDRVLDALRRGDVGAARWLAWYVTPGGATAADVIAAAALDVDTARQLATCAALALRVDAETKAVYLVEDKC